MGDRDRDERKKDPTEELIEDEVEALERVMETIEHLPVAAQMRVLRAGEALLPPAPTTTVTVPR